MFAFECRLNTIDDAQAYFPTWSHCKAVLELGSSTIHVAN